MQSTLIEPLGTEGIVVGLTLYNSLDGMIDSMTLHAPDGTNPDMGSPQAS
jgi:hypothetical protein